MAGFQKQKSSVIAYEEATENEYYAITINPCDKFQFFKSLRRETECIKSLKENLLPYSYLQYIYTLWPEVSPKGRWHWHGIIAFKNINDIYIHVIPTLLSRATVVIKKMTGDREWEVYCKKQARLHEYLRTIQLQPIPQTVHIPTTYADY